MQNNLSEIYNSLQKNYNNKHKRNRVHIIEKNNVDSLLIQGDCKEVLPKIPKESIDLIITDPPYNIGLDYGKNHNDKVDAVKYIQDCKVWLRKCHRVLRKTGSLYLISYPEIIARLFPFLIDTLKFKHRRWITWHYPSNIGHSPKNFTRTQRTILYLTKSDKYTFNNIEIKQHYKNPEVKKIKERIKKGSKGRNSYDLLRWLDLLELSEGLIDVLDINLLKNVSKDRLNGEHPCQLPLKLLEIFIKVSSNKNEILLDPFAGTFTLSYESSNLERNSVGIDLNPKYITLGKKRLKKKTFSKNLLTIAHS